MNAPQTDLQCTAIVLCGGEGLRLGGVDKPLQLLGGQRLIDHVRTRIEPQVSSLVLVANRNIAAYSANGIRVVDDGEWRGCGPLAGIAAGLAAAPSGDVLCVPGDAPLLPSDLLVRLREAARRAGTDAAVVDDGSGWQPLCCLLHTNQLASLRSALTAGERAPLNWLATLPVAVADFSDWPRWGWSLNTAEEWAAAETYLATEPAT